MIQHASSRKIVYGIEIKFKKRLFLRIEAYPHCYFHLFMGDKVGPKEKWYDMNVFSRLFEMASIGTEARNRVDLKVVKSSLLCLQVD
jgi:hypothetical protein